MNTMLVELENTSRGATVAHRVFYLALPPSVFQSVSACLRPECWSARGWNRVIVEKPFGHDSASSRELVSGLAAIFQEHEQYRIDHYLGTCCMAAGEVRAPSDESVWLVACPRCA